MKILGSDFDGTLNHNGITEAKICAIARWRKEGNAFAIVSGRGVGDLLDLYNENSFECDFLIADSGAVVIKTDGTVVCEAQCDGDIAVPLLEHLFKNGCLSARVETDFPCMVYGNAEDAKESGAYTMSDLPTISRFAQISTRCADRAEAERITASVKERFGDMLNPLQNGQWIDIVRNDVNKAAGIYRLMELLGAKYEDVIVVGDNVNDTDMIKEFRSYAMENGVDSIKELADGTVKGVDELIEKELS